MQQFKLFILIFSTSLLFTACTKKENQDEIVVKEYLEVEALCTENTREEKVLFSGYLAYIYNKTKKSGFRHGLVTYVKTLNQTDKNYVYPSEVKFSQIKASSFKQSNIKLTGLSHRASNRDVFKANCDLKVLKRYDYWPK